MTSRVRLLRLGLLSGLVLLSCKPPPPDDTPLSITPSARRSPKAESASEHSGVISTLVGTVAEGTFGPHLWLSERERLVVWAEPRGEQAGIHALALPAEGAPGPAERLEANIDGLRSFEVFDFGKSRALVLMVRRSGSRDLLEALELGSDGRRISGPHVLSETANEILWTRARASVDGAQVFWAEMTRGTATLSGLELQPDRAPPSPKRLAQGVSAWQVGGSQRSLLVTLEGTSGVRSVVLRGLEPNLDVTVPPATLAQGVRGGLDLDLASTRAHSVVAFTRKVGLEERVERAVINDQLEVLEPFAPLTPPRGEQALVKLVANPHSDDCYAVWEEPARRPEGGRSLLLARLDSKRALLEPDATLEARAGSQVSPTFAVADGKLVVLTEARRCAPGKACPDPRIEPLLVRANRDFNQVEASPLELAQLTRQPASLVWDLTCNAGGCFALGASAAAAPAVFLLDLRGEGAVRSPLVARVEAPRPRVLSESLLDEVPELTALRGTASGRGALLTWLSYFDANLPEQKVTRPAPDGKMAAVRALLTSELVQVDDGGSARVAQKTVLSYRARSLGGLDFAQPHVAGPGEASPALVAWSALDAGKPQIFVTLIDPSGKKSKQKMIARPPGEVSDVTALAISGGYLLAWVDGQGTSPEIHALKLDEHLEPVGGIVHLAEGAEQPTGLGLTRFADRVLLSWADARGASRPGFSDVHLLTLHDDSATALGTPRRVAATEMHSHSPLLTALGAGAEQGLLAWLETDPTREDSPSELHVAFIDGVGNFVVPPRPLALPGRVQSFTVECQKERCGIVTALEMGERGELWGVGFEKGEFALPVQLSMLRGAPTQTSAPLLIDNQLFFVDRLNEEHYGLERILLEF